MADANHTKVCRDCGIAKPLSEFSKKDRGILGVRPECKPCRALARRTRYAHDDAHREAVLDAQKRNCTEPPAGYVKRCPTCGETKPAEAFYRSKYSKYSCSSYRKRCQNLLSTSYARENKDKIQPLLRGYSIKRRYGLTVQDYEAMLRRQGFRCAICGTEECATGRNLAVDHCHTTGKVRGLLCANCNRGIGSLKDSEELLQRAIEYLQAGRM